MLLPKAAFLDVHWLPCILAAISLAGSVLLRQLSCKPRVQPATIALQESQARSPVKSTGHKKPTQVDSD
jgi:hypothetical protein